MNDQTQITIAEFVTTNKVKAEAVLLGKRKDEGKDGWKYFLWNVTLTRYNPNGSEAATIDTEFRTGEGCIIPKHLLAHYKGIKRNTLAHEQMMHQWAKPEKPTVETVLNCLVSDSEAMSQSFEEWAGNFGYDSDSRKAEQTYFACQKSGTLLIKLLGRVLLAKLQECERL